MPTENDSLTVQLARLGQKLDGTSERLDDFSDRMDRFEKQRDVDRKELQVITGQIAGIAATCRLHVEQTNSATETAAEAMREAAVAKTTAMQVESSWNDLRKMTRSTGSAEYQSVTKALEERAKFKERDRESLETSVVNVVLRTFEERDKADREERRQEAAILLQKNEDRRKKEDEKRKRITWIVGLIVTILGALSSTGFWNLYQTAREERQKVIKVIEHERARKGRKSDVATAPLE